MKSLSPSLILLALIMSVSCSRDRDQDDSENNQASGLAAFLDGRFNVEAIDISGSVTVPGGFTSALDSAGNGGSGYYDFNSADKSVNYDVTGQVKFTLLTQTVNFPVPVNGQGAVDVVSETRFTITPNNGSPQICEVVEAKGNTLIFTTRSVQDTMGFSFDTNLELFLKKE